MPPVAEFCRMKSLPAIGNRKKIFYHATFCVMVVALRYAAIYWYFGGFRERNTWWSVLASCIFFLVCIYIGRWLCQRWYLRNRLFQFLVNTMFACAGITVFWWLFIKYIFNQGNAELTELFISEMPFFIIGMAGGIFIKLVRASMQKQVEDAHIAARQKESELSLLQSQLSPHFLFNTLNNVYGISITQHERVPALLLKLSDLLRYSVYDAKKSFVPLKEELQYINNYIDFEKIRISDRLILKTDVDSTGNTAALIAPMVLIVFVENAFKHSKNTLEQKIYIDISIKIVDNFIQFSMKNSHGKGSGEGNIIKENSGLGLANTIKRLDLLYGGDYSLKQSDAGDLYTVQLNLKVK